MEIGLTVAAAAQSATPLCFSSHAFIHQQFPSLSTAVASGCSSSTFYNGGRKRNPSSLKALTGNSFSSSVTGRRTLSSNWDTGNFSFLATSTSRIPRLEDLDPTRMLIGQRIVFLGSEVDDITADLIINQLLFLDAEDPTKDIKIFINSPGGSITAGMGIYDAMKFCKADVSTICFGLAASMGALILLGGTKGKRFCMPNARVMIHQLHGVVAGGPLDSSIRLRENNYHGLKVNKIISRSTGQPLEKVQKDTEYDHYMNAWEAKAYGIVDEVIDDGKPGLVAPPTDASAPPMFGISKYLASKGEDGPPVDKVLPPERRHLQKGISGVVVVADKKEGYK